MRTPSDPALFRASLAPLWLAVAGFAVFATDALTPPWFPHGTVYVPLVLVAALIGGVQLLRFAMLAAVLATIVGGGLTYLASSAGDGNLIALDRSMSLLAIAVCGVLAERMVLGRLALVETAEALRCEKAAGEESHRLLALAGEMGSFGGWTLDLATGEVAWSDAVAAVFGEEPGSTPSLDQLAAQYSPEERARLLAAADRCIATGEPYDLELRLEARGDRPAKWVATSGRAVRDAAGEVVRLEGSFQDISSLKAAEEVAESSRRRLEVMADSMPLIVWGADPTGELDYFNEPFEDYTGRDRRSMAGSAWLELLHPDDRDRVVQEWRHSVTTGAPYETEFRVRGRDGVHRWHLVMALPERGSDDEIVGWWGSAADIDEHRRLEAESRELADRLAGTLESIADGVLTVDSEWRFTFLNSNAERMLGPSEELLGKVFWEVYPETLGTVFEESHRRAVAERRTVRFEAYYGPLRAWYQINSYPHDGGVTMFFRDTTEQRVLAERAAQAQRMDSLGQLTGGVAHDFNNLLTVVLGNAEALAMQLEPEDPRHELATMIVDCAERGADLTHNLLAFARRQPLEPAPVDVTALVAGMEPVLRRTVGETVEVVLALGADLPRCMADAAELESAVLNLCINSRDAMTAGGRLEIATDLVDLDERYAVAHPSAVPGSYVRVTVSDTGHGIAERDLDRVLEPFFSTKPFGKGSGLGLPRVHGFVQQSRGHLAIESTVGVGTSVALHLPLAGAGEPADVAAGLGSGAAAAETESSGVLGPSDAPAAGAPGGRHRSAGPAVEGRTGIVLLVEDDAEVRHSVARRLQSLGYDVQVAAAGHEALTVLATEEPVDLLLTDVMLAGGINGPQLAEQAAELRPGLPVLFTSGYTDEALSLGRPGSVVPVLAKPYSTTALADAVAEALGAPAGRGR